MTYTFKPEQKFARASGPNMRISTKSAQAICRAIRRKTLRRAKRLLQDMAAERRGLGGKYHTKTAGEMLRLLESCEKNAEFLGLDSGRLFVHASAHQGTTMRRRRRKSGFGHSLKSTNMEVMLIERGRPGQKVPKAKIKPRSQAEKEIEAEKAAAIGEIGGLKEKAGQLKEKVEAAS